jgi:hypothetical protein
MKAEAIPLGAKLLQQEVALDQWFASHSITAESLKTMTEQIGLTQAALRDTHLKYHLRTARAPIQFVTPLHTPVARLQIGASQIHSGNGPACRSWPSIPCRADKLGYKAILRR